MMAAVDDGSQVDERHIVELRNHSRSNVPAWKRTQDYYSSEDIACIYKVSSIILTRMPLHLDRRKTHLDVLTSPK